MTQEEILKILLTDTSIMTPEEKINHVFKNDNWTPAIDEIVYNNPENIQDESIDDMEIRAEGFETGVDLALLLTGHKPVYGALPNYLKDFKVE